MKQANDERIQMLSEKLQDYLDHIDTNEEYMRLLRFQARFHHYSANNAILIMLTRPNASYVAGYQAWKKMNRYVKKGEKAIPILAPLTYKELDEDEKRQVTCIRGFRIANVFDLAQTAGDDEVIPIVIKGLAAKGEITQEKFDQLKACYPHSVVLKHRMAPKGCYDAANMEITINDSYTLAQQTKTLFHEWTHHLCHIEQLGLDYATEEVVAESVAYIVCEHIGLDVSAYSVPYIQAWRHENSKLLEVMGTVQRLSRVLLARCGLTDETIEIVSGRKG